MSSAFPQLLLHERTKELLEIYSVKKSSGLLLVGPIGSGKQTVGKVLSARMLELENVEQLDNYPHFLHIKKPGNKQEISIDTVREVRKNLQLKTVGKEKIHRIVLIEEADKLSIEAQNALLKTLEETSSDTIFILTTTSVQSILPTIASRTQHIQIAQINLDDARSYFDGFTDRELESAWKISQGNVGLMQALLDKEQSHPLKEAIEDAKKFLRKTQYERSLMLNEITKDKQSLQFFLNALDKVTSALHHSAVEKNNNNQSNRLLLSRRLIYDLNQALSFNVSPRNIGLKLVMGLTI